MNEFKLLKIDIRNFKAIEELSVDFANTITNIRGRNGSGKTSIFDAFTWCLFGKDHEDRTDKGRGAFTVKKVVDGNTIMNQDHEVVITAMVNGHVMTLGRRLSETWRTRNGEQQFDGDKTTCMWDGIEIGVNEYNKRIESEIIGQTQFKMLTNPMYFATLPWKEQLNFLTQAFAADVTIENVAETNEEWKAELAKLSPKVTLADVGTQISTEKKRIGDRLKEIPSIIKGIRSAMPQNEDWEALQADKDRYNAELAEIENAMKSTTDAENARYNDIQAKQQEINVKREKMIDLVAAENKARYEAAAKSNEEIEKVEQAIKEAESKKDSLLKEREAIKEKFKKNEKSYKEEYAKLKNIEQRLLKDWDEVNGSEFAAVTENLICPLCKKDCDSQRTIEWAKANEAEARRTFNEDKAKRLNYIDTEGCENDEKMKKLETDYKVLMKNSDKELQDNYAAYKDIFDSIANLKEKYYSMKRVEVTRVLAEDLPECTQLNKEIEALEKDIAEMKGKPIDVTEQMNQKNEIKSKISEIDSKLGVRKLIESNEKKIGELDAEISNLAKQKDALDKRANTIDELQRAYVDAVESIINKAFAYVKFKTRDVLVNGEVTETCYPTLNGVKFGDVNDAGKMFAGLDIINTLNKVYDMRAPIFIDRAESVTTQTYPYDGQLILLRADYSDLTVEKMDF